METAPITANVDQLRRWEQQEPGAEGETERDSHGASPAAQTARSFPFPRCAARLRRATPRQSTNTTPACRADRRPAGDAMQHNSTTE